MQNQDVEDSKQEKLPIVNDSKYKKMTETLLSDESEIHNLSYTNLVHLADYLKAYQSTLVKQNQFQAAKEISELKEKVLIELKSQTKQLKQYNKKEKSMIKEINEFDEETEKLERELLQKQAQELKNFEEEWNGDLNSPEYIKAKAQLDERFQQEIEDLHNSREQQQNKIQMFKDEIRQQNKKIARSSYSTRPKSSSASRRTTRCGSSYSKNSRPFTANTKPQTRRSTSSVKNRYGKANSTSTPNNYSIFFPLYIWIGKKKDNTNSNTNSKNMNNDQNNNNNDTDKSNNDNNIENMQSNQNQETDNNNNNNINNDNINNNNINNNNTNNNNINNNNINNDKTSVTEAEELDITIISKSSSTLISKNNEENDDLDSTMGTQLLMLAERPSSEDEDENECFN